MLPQTAPALWARPGVLGGRGSVLRMPKGPRGLRDCASSASDHVVGYVRFLRLGQSSRVKAFNLFSRPLSGTGGEATAASNLAARQFRCSAKNPSKHLGKADAAHLAACCGLTGANDASEGTDIQVNENDPDGYYAPLGRLHCAVFVTGASPCETVAMTQAETN